jgi:uncharacterized repeat protein (TIGR03803 family)
MDFLMAESELSGRADRNPTASSILFQSVRGKSVVSLPDAVYANAHRDPTVYTASGVSMMFCGYDNAGNLSVDARGKGDTFALLDPYAGLTNVNGTLYGTTVNGGTYQCGTVFSVTRTGVEEVLHSFGYDADGCTPYAGLVYVKATLYGTTRDEGAYGNGTIFSVSLTGSTKVLHSFGYGSDGSAPFAGLIDVGETQYGTTVFGGTYGDGTVFASTP